MNRDDLAATADGGPLAVLPNGLVLVRRRKHEPIDLEGLTAEQLLRRTEPRRAGSKFAASWPLARYVAWLTEQVTSPNWPLPAGSRGRTDIELDEVAGVSNGVEVHTIRVDSDGRHVHAYPVPDPQ